MPGAASINDRGCASEDFCARRDILLAAQRGIVDDAWAEPRPRAGRKDFLVLMLIFLVLVLLLVQVMLPGRYLTEQVGNAAQMGPRDDLPEPSRDLARSRRALANLQETLPVFLVLAVLSIVLGEQGWLSLFGAGLYFVARVAHAYCYMKGLVPWRSISFLASLVGNVLLAIPLVPHIWG